MGYVTPEQIAQARQLDLLTYLQQHEPDNLARLGNGQYCTKEHDSLKISNGMWHWFSRGFGGKTALDYLIKVRGIPFVQAVEALSDSRVLPVSPAQERPPKPRERVFQLPEAARDMSAVRNYLTGRGIHIKVINYCITTGKLYESAKYHNAVFVGYGQDDRPCYASLRGTRGDFKGEVSGSDKSFSFSMLGDPDGNSVHLFEAPVDLLSYATMELLAGRDFRKSNLLSLAGVYLPGKDKPYAVPCALSRYLQEHPGTQRIVLHLDNDEVGRGATLGIISALGEQYEVVDQPPKCGKDVNDQLKEKLGISCRQGKEEVR